MEVAKCVRSGECCKIPCGFGQWNTEKTMCEHLVGGKPGEYGCGIYDEIIKDPTSAVSPAFGSGCCRTLFNESRSMVIKERYGGAIPTIEIDDY